jgi:hypothetical protein
MKTATRLVAAAALAIGAWRGLDEVGGGGGGGAGGNG